jgi:4'-phosphopantetheinyl transferase EntD
MTIAQAWQDLLPPNISICAGPVLDNVPPLTNRERVFAGELSASRMREFASGRAYARRALTLLGVVDVDLVVGPHRAPLWPPGIVGSITHTLEWGGGHVAAAVGRESEFRGVGIDVERDDPLHPTLWPFVLSQGEHCHILTLPARRRAAEAQAIWCAKEAVIKAARRIIEPTMLEIAFANGHFVAILGSNCLDGRTNRTWHGRVACANGLILAAAFEGASQAAARNPSDAA